MKLETTKLELIEWLTNLEDEATIAYLKEMKDATETDQDWWDALTAPQQQSIERGLNDIEEGKVSSHESVKAKYGL